MLRIFQEANMLTLPHLYIITAVVIFFNCVGLFGNINVVLAVSRAPVLRKKGMNRRIFDGRSFHSSIRMFNIRAC
ncbi:hypothetical protein Y032_0120g915 [Ancylostoma ceylanicum]|uniref:Uncharacterized protein n=1 Tax=Ancylostoma ceylanicum TaxID=53326 RepID=A0A016TAN9_9BILA|nr:hypothetical protein Y032_0120g915 [Ancylostoma ceylanicum]